MFRINFRINKEILVLTGSFLKRCTFLIGIIKFKQLKIKTKLEK